MHSQKVEAAEYMGMSYKLRSKSETNLDKAEALMVKAIAWFELAEQFKKESK
jgi:hypothetical protein